MPRQPYCSCPRCDTLARGLCCVYRWAYDFRCRGCGHAWEYCDDDYAPWLVRYWQ
jgi:hypothetical protein